MAINEKPLTGGDWTFRIKNDLMEVYNSFLGQPDTYGNTITFRPALNTTATVTFTTTTWSGSNGFGGAPGHFLIGEQYNRYLTPFTPTRPINNVVIDGSQHVGGSDVSLFFRRENLPGGCPVIFIYGGCKDITVRNCDIFTDSGEARPVAYWRMPVPIYIHTQTRSNAELNLLTERVAIEGCVLQTIGTYATPEVLYLGPSAYPQNNNNDGIQLSGLRIRNNYIVTSSCAVEVLSPLSATIDNNQIVVRSNADPDAYAAPVINVGTNAMMEHNSTISVSVTNNEIEFRPGSLGTNARAGIGMYNRSWSGSYLIANNIISGLEASSDPTKIRAGIIASAEKETTAIIAHNSVFIKPAAHTTADGKCYGIGADRPFWWTTNTIFHPDSNISVHNNIVHVEQAGASAIHQEGTRGTFISDNNVLSVVPGAYTSTWSQLGTNGWLETHATLDDRRTTTGQDMNSVSVNPFEPVSPGLGTWTRAGAGPGSDPAVADLHFTNYPGSIYLAPKIPGLDTDIDGDPREESLAIMGADEVPHHRSLVNSWGLY